MEIYTDGGEDKYCFVIPDKNVVKNGYPEAGIRLEKCWDKSLN